MKRSHEPPFRLLFGAGGTLAALFGPALVFVIGITLPLGWLPDAATDPARVRSLLTHPARLGATAMPIGGFPFHATHRITHTLHDLSLPRGLLPVGRRRGLRQSFDDCAFSGRFSGSSPRSRSPTLPPRCRHRIPAPHRFHAVRASRCLHRINQRQENAKVNIKLCIALATTLFGSILAPAALVHAQVNCCALPRTTVTGFVNNDVIAHGCSCTIARTATVNGNLEQLGAGSLTVRGNVNGGVSESGLGNLLIDGGRIAGDCSEADGGNLVVRPGSYIDGSLTEAGPGSVTVTVGIDGPTKGDIEESGNGDVTVTVLGGAYEGNLRELDAGTVTVSVAAGSAFKGGIEEDADGSVQADVEGVFEGNIVELGAGDLTTAGAGWFKGNSEHELPGTCTNTIVRFEGSACNPL